VCTRHGLDDERSRPDKALLQGGSGWDSQALIQAGLVHAAAKRAAGLGPSQVGWSRLDVVVSEATGLQDSKVGPQALADILIGGTPCMFPRLPGASDADGNGPSTTRGVCRKPLVATRLAGADQSRPGQGVSPLTEGMPDGDKIGALQAGSGTAQPMLALTNQAHRRLSCCKGEREPQDTTQRSASQVSMRVGKN
jgi:hypothetical protein